VVEGAHVSTVVKVIGISSVSFGTQPADTPVLSTINPAVKVVVLDTEGRAVHGFAVTMSIGPNPPNPGALGGTLTQITDAAGVATFPDLNLDYLGVGYTLLATVNTPIGQFTGISSQFSELRIGDPCLAPEAAVSTVLACADSDGDGLPDAWESAGGVDINGDGKIGPKYDVLLPGADPHKVDVYLHYDYTFAADHDHNPPAQAMQYIVDAFAAHGISLHIDPQHSAVSEDKALVVQLTNFPKLEADPACVGPHGVSMYQLRQLTNFGARRFAYHYMIFSHFSECDPTTGACSKCGQLSAEITSCGLPEFPDGTRSGVSELYGDDAIVSTGYITDALGIPISSLPLEFWAGLSMHEFGHNLALFHGGGDCINQKPNYLSVMNYDFYLNGIPVAASPGDNVPKSCSSDADCPVTDHVVGAHCSTLTNSCFRIDYSDRQFPTLDERNLDETAGLNGGAADTDISFGFQAPASVIFVASNGSPVDWNSNGIIETGVGYNITGNQQSFVLLQGWNDWATSNGLFTNLHFDFQKSGDHFNNDSNSGPVSTTTMGPAPLRPGMQAASSCAGAAGVNIDPLLEHFAALVAARNPSGGRASVDGSGMTTSREKSTNNQLPAPKLWP
jgi:hypothetical protein